MRFRFDVLLIVSFLLLPLAGYSQTREPSQLSYIPRIPADHRIAYGSESSQFADLRLPEGEGPHPVAIVVHGGCWQSLADLEYMGGVAKAITDSGWATWSIEFRRLGEPGGGWPGTFLDVGDATDHLRDIAGEYNLDLGRVASIGHSSGGHLALWLAARHKLPEESEVTRNDPLKIHAAISLAGICDLRAYQNLDGGGCGPAAIPYLLGLPTNEELALKRLSQISPAELLPLGVPQLILIGERDQVVPESIGASYSKVAAATGDRIALIRVPRVGHLELVLPQVSTWGDQLSIMLRFMDEAMDGEMDGETGGVMDRAESGAG